MMIGPLSSVDLYLLEEAGKYDWVWLRCIIRTSALDAMYYDVISVRVRVLVRLKQLILHFSVSG